MKNTAVSENEKRENIFRKFQIEKFKRNRSVPCVSMTVDICIDQLESKRQIYNKTNDKISLTHLIIKSTSISLKLFPILYSYFDGKNVIKSKLIKINLPVSENNHVEYVMIESPELKTLQEISAIVRNEASRIKEGKGYFYLRLKKLFALPYFVRSFMSNIPSSNIKYAYENYGNFPITNFGSFNVKNGIPVLSSPVCSVLCIGMIQKDEITGKSLLPVTLVFDHRPIDGAYGGKFLNELKDLIENRTDLIFK